jgi:hypothetical protein
VTSEFQLTRRVLLRQLARSATVAASVPLLDLMATAHATPSPRPIPAAASFKSVNPHTGQPSLITSTFDPLTDKVNRVECNFNPNGGDLRLTLKTTDQDLSADLTRQIPPPSGCTVMTPPIVSWESSIHDIWFVNIQGLLNISSSGLVTAWFASNTIGHLRFGDRRDGAADNGFCSTQVQAARLDATHWEVSAAGSDLAVLAQFDQSGHPQPVGYFSLPFCVTVARL